MIINKEEKYRKKRNYLLQLCTLKQSYAGPLVIVNFSNMMKPIPFLALLLVACSPAKGPDASAPSLTFTVDPFWPKPLPNNWILGQVAGVAVDSLDHVWIIHRPLSITAEEAGAVQNPPLGECCVPAPPVIEFDAEGNVVQAWGAQDSTQRWPKTEHGIFIDANRNVWVGGNNAEDQVVLKYSANGKLLLQIGEWGITRGSNDSLHLGRPADMAVDLPANEVYVADGYGNRRVIVFDAMTGAYKRHWGAYGSVPVDGALAPYDPSAPVSKSFANPVHSVVLSNNGLLYVADRTNNRIQVFQKNGTFEMEGIVASQTRSMGAAWDLTLSGDAGQKYVYLADGVNKKVWILTRSDLRVVGSFGRGGRQAGQFGWVHNIAMDSKGNLFTAEVETGKRIQKFHPTE